MQTNVLQTTCGNLLVLYMYNCAYESRTSFFFILCVRCCYIHTYIHTYLHSTSLQVHQFPVNDGIMACTYVSVRHLRRTSQRRRNQHTVQTAEEMDITSRIEGSAASAGSRGQMASRRVHQAVGDAQLTRPGEARPGQSSCGFPSSSCRLPSSPCGFLSLDCPFGRLGLRFPLL